jgi:hypothetical protein
MKNKNYRYLYLFSCSLWFQEQVLIVKKIIHPGSGKIYPGDPDPGGNKEPDPGSGPATLAGPILYKLSLLRLMNNLVPNILRNATAYFVKAIAIDN